MYNPITISSNFFGGILENMKRGAPENNREGSRAIFESRQLAQMLFRCELCKQNIRGKSRFDTHVSSMAHTLLVQEEVIFRQRREYRDTQNLEAASINVSVGHTLMHGDDDTIPLDDDPDNPPTQDLLRSPSPLVTFSPSVRDSLLLMGFQEPISVAVGGGPPVYPNSTRLDSPPTMEGSPATKLSYVTGVIFPLPPEMILRSNQQF